MRIKLTATTLPCSVPLITLFSGTQSIEMHHSLLAVSSVSSAPSFQYGFLKNLQVTPCHLMSWRYQALPTNCTLWASHYIPIFCKMFFRTTPNSLLIVGLPLYRFMVKSSWLLLAPYIWYLASQTPLCTPTVHLWPPSSVLHHTSYVGFPIFTRHAFLHPQIAAALWRGDSLLQVP